VTLDYKALLKLITKKKGDGEEKDRFELGNMHFIYFSRSNRCMAIVTFVSLGNPLSDKCSLKENKTSNLIAHLLNK
jgi:hypothetical protein